MGITINPLIKRLIILFVCLILLIALLCNFMVIVNGGIVYRFTENYTCYDLEADNEALKNLEKLHEIRHLEIYSYSITNIDFVKDMRDLRYLWIESEKVEDYGILKSCDDLDTLCLRYIDKQNLEDISKNEHLKVLHIKNCHDLSDISSLSNLTGLTSLGLCNADITDISTILCLKDLKDLDLFSNRSLEDINGIEQLDQLEEINLAGTSVTDLKPLKNVKTLKNVVLSVGQIDEDTTRLLYENGIEVEFL